MGKIGATKSPNALHKLSSHSSQHINTYWSRVDAYWSRVDAYWSRVDAYWSRVTNTMRTVPYGQPNKLDKKIIRTLQRYNSISNDLQIKSEKIKLFLQGRTIPFESWVSCRQLAVLLLPVFFSVSDGTAWRSHIVVPPQETSREARVPDNG